MKRSDGYERNDALETLLESTRGYLEPADQRVREELLRQYDTGWPTVFLHGAHRAGSTVFLQWLATSGMVAYPTNLLSRFYGTTLIGARIQQLIADPRYAFRDELADLQFDSRYESVNGKTSGALAPNEFWYFWRRFLPTVDRDYFSDEELGRSGDLTSMREDIELLSRIEQKPFALKAMIMNQSIPALASAFPNSVFINIHRDPVFNIQSALEARKRQFGDLRSWYSFRIREYPDLVDLPPLTAVSGQIAAIRRSVEIGFEAIPNHRKLDISYEQFCHDPVKYGDAIAAALERAGVDTYYDRSSVASAFECTNYWRLAEYTEDEAANEWDRMKAWANERIPGELPGQRLPSE